MEGVLGKKSLVSFILNQSIISGGTFWRLLCSTYSMTSSLTMVKVRPEVPKFFWAPA